MITVELRQAAEGPGDYQVAATLTVADDGTYQVDDPDRKLLTELHVLVLDDTAEGGLREVHLEEDPATWARNLSTLHRGGYWVPVITHDDGTPPGLPSSTSSEGAI